MEPCEDDKRRTQLDAVHAERVERWARHGNARGSDERDAILEPVLVPCAGQVKIIANRPLAAGVPAPTAGSRLTPHSGQTTSPRRPPPTPTAPSPSPTGNGRHGPRWRATGECSASPSSTKPAISSATRTASHPAASWPPCSPATRTSPPSATPPVYKAGAPAPQTKPTAPTAGVSAVDDASPSSLTAQGSFRIRSPMPPVQIALPDEQLLDLASCRRSRPARAAPVREPGFLGEHS
jgi:hypothetical protein